MSTSDNAIDRLGIIRITPELLHQLLKLPADMRIINVQYKPERHCLLLLVTGESAPIRSPEGQHLLEIRPTYVQREARLGDYVCELASLGS